MTHRTELPPKVISIHALREEGDPPVEPKSLIHFYFYPRPPRGGRPEPCKVVIYALIFLSTPSARRATYNTVDKFWDCYISIHALREEGDLACSFESVHFGIFLSTPSARRATSLQFLSHTFLAYFYPRPPRGGRLYV